MTFGFENPQNLWFALLLVPAIAVVWASRRALLPRQLLTSTGLRVGALLCFIGAIAGLTRYEESKALAVVYLLDSSASIPEASAAKAQAVIQEGLRSQRRKDLAAVVVFGDQALIEQPLTRDLQLQTIESTPGEHQSDLEAALRLGTALMPADRSRRIVLLSDGEETRGDARAEAQFAASQDLEITVSKLSGEEGPDIRISDLRVPAEVQEGSPFQLQVVAESDEPTTATLRLYRNEHYLGELPVDFTEQTHKVVRLEQEATAPGLLRYRAVLAPDDPAQDAFSANNEFSATVQISGPPRVLLVSTRTDKALHLGSTLSTEKLQVERVGLDQLPGSLSGFRDYSVVILDNVPSYGMSRRQQEALRSFVRDLGRGLIMLGGDRSYGLGGYYHSPIAEAMPVHMDIKDKSHFPKLGMVLALDKSCSMGGGAGSKLAMAKEAAIETANLLSDRDMLGVISFDGAASWVTPLESLHNREGVIETIGSLRSGGGTDIYPALETSVKALSDSDAALKHMILLSDGMTTSGDYQGLLNRARANKITLTAIAIGSDADRTTMQQLSEWGGGNYYLVTDPLAIPAVFTREAMLASRAFLIEKELKPQGASPSDILVGMDSSSLPPIHGLVATQLKDRSTLALKVNQPEQGDLPLLAHWNYGVGRSVAWTSDATSRWSKQWLEDPLYEQLWTQIVRWAAGSESPSHLVVDSRIEDGMLEIQVDALDAAGRFQNFLTGEARVVAPDLSTRPLELQQVGPGKYRATTPADQLGSWLIGIALYKEGNLTGHAVSEAVQPYSPEFKPTEDGDTLLQAIGTIGAGGWLSDPSDAFARPQQARMIPTPLWSWLVVLGSLLFLADVAARRLEWRSRPQPARRRRPAEQAPQKRAASKRVAAPTADTLPEEEAPAPEPTANAYASRLLKARDQARKKMRDEP
jgi:Mg-chelatase subunit ChlD